MPLHDWTTVVAGTFHDFHYIWIAEIRRRLNGGLLPEGYYAQAEQVTGAAAPDVLTLHNESESADIGPADAAVPPKSAIVLLDSPPQVQLTQSAEERLYARKRDRVAVRHRSGDRTVALIDVVSPGNKHSVAKLRRFPEKIDSALEAGVHCLVIDIHPPGRHDAEGLHAAFWDYAFGEPQETPTAPRATMSSYRADIDNIATAYVQPVELNGTLPDMPLFLTADWYINLPLEETYMNAWAEFPDRWKRVVCGKAEV
ncbi:MAG: DUF4058 family protein [Planctomycetaceae bacterium]|nr:DUF4058 family protein [Planctomycetaceae bacterium]